MTNWILVTTTTSQRDDAERLGQLLLERRLAACVQVLGPIASQYWWKGTLESAEEWQCVAKTTGDRFAAVAEVLQSSHPYEVPEIVAVPIVAASDAYLRWAAGELGLPNGTST